MHIDWLAVARNPSNDEIERLIAWRNHECSQWLAAVRGRGLRLDDTPIEYHARIRESLRELERAEPKSLEA